MPNPLKAIHATYHFLAWALDHDQVPNDIRRSLELVRTCNSDLQHLIELRNECLPLLRRRPKVLARVHTIIEAAQKGLEEVGEIVERCRPEAHHRGKTPLSSRMAWVLVDASEFRSQEPIVSRHHAAVLAELNFLRQIALLAPVSEPEKIQKNRRVQENATVFDNVALLGDVFGGFNGDLSLPQLFLQNTVSQLMLSYVIVAPSKLSPDPKAAAETLKAQDVTSVSLQPSPGKSSSSQTLHIEHSRDSLPEVLPVNMPHLAPTKSPTTSSTSKFDLDGLAGLAVLLGDPLFDQTPPSQTSSVKIEVPEGPVTVPSHMPTAGLPLPRPNYSSENIACLNQNDRPPSITYAPPALSSTSPDLHQRQLPSLAALPIITRTVTQHQNVSSTALPGHFTWTNTSSTTVSSFSTGLGGSDLLSKSSTWPDTIAELDNSPFQMVPVTSPLDQAISPDNVINTAPVELPVDDCTAIKKPSPTQGSEECSVKENPIVGHSNFDGEAKDSKQGHVVLAGETAARDQ
ncbi:hypothetical protein F53441_1154 [Fusarium austroafricanum]|uniref:Uncharacterized protein n=1 Tax=Fusarium austroafricanum TaxID=2364996 RepID=A0A8H4KW41_9HYPO|nr:hypothetical protein F53441_1154 [Fusarium austroafricanum]